MGGGGGKREVASVHTTIKIMSTELGVKASCLGTIVPFLLADATQMPLFRWWFIVSWVSWSNRSTRCAVWPWNVRKRTSRGLVTVRTERANTVVQIPLFLC